MNCAAAHEGNSIHGAKREIMTHKRQFMQSKIANHQQNKKLDTSFWSFSYVMCPIFLLKTENANAKAKGVRIGRLELTKDVNQVKRVRKLACERRTKRIRACARLRYEKMDRYFSNRA